MGREKAIPKKLTEHINPIDYVPIRKKRKMKSKPKNRINPIYPLTKSNKIYHIGEMLIGTSNNAIPIEYDTCTVEFLPENHLILTFECIITKEKVNALIQLNIDPQFVQDLITTKSFAIKITKKQEDIYFDLYFRTLPLEKFTKKTATCIQSLFELLYDIKGSQTSDDEGKSGNSLLEINELYRNISSMRADDVNLGTESMQHPLLKPKLRPYQQSAVRWMISRENDDNCERMHPQYTEIILKSGLTVYYDRYSGYIDPNRPTIIERSRGGILADEMGLGKTVEVLSCILNHPKCQQQVLTQNGGSPTVETSTRKRKREGDVRTKSPEKLETNNITSKKSQARLALEMWYETCLAPKTPKKLTGIQCICGSKDDTNQVACTDCNKIQHSDCFGYRSSFGPYRCPQCWTSQPLLECAATLIVTPTSLRTQWCNEICKHINDGTFKVLQYDGSSIHPLYPTQLLDYDVVMTTYSVLQSDLRLVDNEKSLTLRGERKYSPPGSCLTWVKWWRLCLDEAQTVEVPRSMVASMAGKLQAHHRWAVTGTPISKAVSDLYGLIEYLHIEPYRDQFTWDCMLYRPYLDGDRMPMYRFLAGLLWRSSKSDVIDQVDIPSQTVEEHPIRFSAVEQYFYKCEHSLNCNLFLEKTARYDSNLTLQSFDKSTLKTILAPFLSLRQVCTYPNSIRTRYLATKKAVTSMKDLLDALIVKNTNENDEFLRVVISSLNGLAGIHLLLNNPKQAVEEYRKVLEFHSKDHHGQVTVDKLQVVHAMYNLNEVLEVFPDDVGRTLKDDELTSACEDLEKLYIKKFIDQSHVALQEYLLLANKVEALEDGFHLKSGQWYCDILDWVTLNHLNQELNQKITNAHQTNNIECKIDLNNSRTMLYQIATWDDDRSKLRSTLLDYINTLFDHLPDDEFVIRISAELVKKATDCHLRPEKKKKSVKLCPICTANDHLKAYEAKLFYMNKRTAHFEDMSLLGSWKPTCEEIIFKSILSLAKGKNANSDWIEDGQTHIRLLNELKKEFKEVRKLWTHLDQQTCAQDELDICKLRLRLKDGAVNGGNVTKVNPVLKNLNYKLDNKLESIHLLSEHELDYHRSLLQNEERQNSVKLEKNLGVRKYLETLKHQQYEGQTPDPCPICKNQLEQHWSIISCGHSYCIECIQLLIEKNHFHGEHMTCSVCRANHLVSEISYVRPGEVHDDSDVNAIKGNYSSKVEAVIRLVQQLRNFDEFVKILIFSTWIPTLSYIKGALVNNNIKCELVHTGQIVKQIERFKNIEDGVTTLLLPISLGSKGLNLIEATHVILIEPLLNPGDELQAVGRVHRIGQTKPTVVHKFYVQNTIEENIHKAISTNTANWEKNKVILRQLIDLFVNHTITEAIDEESL